MKKGAEYEGERLQNPVGKAPRTSGVRPSAGGQPLTKPPLMPWLLGAILGTSWRKAASPRFFKGVTFYIVGVEV